LPQSLLPRFNLSKKPGFFDPGNQKPGFFHNLCFPVLIYRKNPVSLTPVQAVRRCEIVDLICKLLMATHPTILNRVQR
jgi:hypothetical protein